MRKSLPWVVIGLALGSVLLWVSVRGMNVDHAFALLADARPTYLAAAVLATFAFIAVKTLRWSVLLAHRDGATFHALHRAVYLGSAANLIVSHAGEIVRAYMIRRKLGLAVSETLGSIALERVLDMLAMLLLLSYLLFASQGALPQALANAGLFASVLACVAVAGIVSMFLYRERALESLTVLTRSLPQNARYWIAEQFHRALGGLDSIQRPARLSIALALSLVQWAAMLAAVWFSAHAVGISVTWTASLAVLILLVIGLALPTAPGYVGTTQAAFTVALAFAEIGAAPAFAASIAYSLCVGLSTILVGAFLAIGSRELWRRGRS